MTISVSIATYNRAPMVREAVVAALAQSTPPDEVVVSDDASAEATARYDSSMNVSSAFGLPMAALTPRTPSPQPRSTMR